MRRHLDRVTSAILGGINNRLIGLLVLNMHQVARYTCRRRNTFRYVQMSVRKSRRVFLVLLKRVRDRGKAGAEDMERHCYCYDSDSST